MRIQTLSLAVLALTLALPAVARDRTSAKPPADGTVEVLRAEILLQADLARPLLGDAAADLLQERARFARRLEQLELVVDDALAVTDQVLAGTGDAAALLLRSPSAVLLRDARPRVQAARQGQVWTRGAWMDSPDGA